MDPIIQKANDKINIVINQSEGITNTWKCAQCGASLDEGSKFCKFCGTAAPDNTVRAEILIDDKNAAQAAKYKYEMDKRKAKIAESRRKVEASQRRIALQIEKQKAKNEKARLRASRFENFLIGVFFLIFVAIIVAFIIGVSSQSMAK